MIRARTLGERSRQGWGSAWRDKDPELLWIRLGNGWSKNSNNLGHGWAQGMVGVCLVQWHMFGTVVHV